jgi:hypothetical protein
VNVGKQNGLSVGDNLQAAPLGGARDLLLARVALAQRHRDELAHHVHGDIWKGIVFESGLILAGFAKPSAAIAIAAILIAGGGLIAARDMVWKR